MTGPAAQLRRFMLFNYLLLFPLILFIAGDSAHGKAVLFLLVVAASYALLYLLPVWAIARLLLWVPRMAPVAMAVACVLMAALVFLLYLDGVIHDLYGFHLNGFVWNLVTTPGGIESMGGTAGTRVTVALIAVGLVLLQVFLMWLARLTLRRGWLELPGARWAFVPLLLLMLVDRTAYGVSHFTAYRPVLAAAQAVPFYIPTTFRGLARKLGLSPGRATSVAHLQAHQDGRLVYPAAPLHLADKAPQYNILWLTCESLRWDMLTPEIMPNLWAFSQRGRRFTNHVSGGNGTRMGIFSMFYGLPGSYWFSVLDERQPPLLVQLLQQRDYRFGLFSGAKFTYPEFDKTVWASVPANVLQEDMQGEGWQRDERNVSRMLDFIGDGRGAPFMGFLFFESAHAHYYFPPDDVIRDDYLVDFNYATVDVDAEIGLIFNRYVNAAHHIDRQMGRLFDALEARGLLENTVIVVTSDHGEEFLEKGRWGHNSAFHDEQIRTPMVLVAPGVAPAVVEAPTSHLDIVPTLMPMLGVTNPVSDYASGVSLLSPDASRYRLVASWDALGYIGPDYKVALPLQPGGVFEMGVVDRLDQPVADPDAVMALLQPALASVLDDMAAFYRRH